MKIGDFVQWGDQVNYPGLSGIVIKTRHQTPGSLPREDSPEIFVHWLTFPHDYTVGEGWEEETSVHILSIATGETE